VDIELVKGWCPGALRPMESGDGLIARLKPTGGIVPLAQAMCIAKWARRWGNGQIDLTSRANLQLRGLSPESLPALQDELLTENMLDASPEGEAVRNVVASPLAGIDPDAVLDIRPLTRALERRLASDDGLHTLPAKFGFAIDDGGGFGLDGVGADIRFVGFGTGDGPALAIGLDGDGQTWLGPCRPDQMVDVAIMLARSFLKTRKTAPRIKRIRDWVGTVGAGAIGDCCGLRPFAGMEPRTVRPLLGLHPISAAGHLRQSHDDGKAAIAGLGLPFGRVSADNLARLVERAIQFAGQELRLTPWRTVLIPFSSMRDARALLAALEGVEEFIFDEKDPRRHVAACVGAPACLRATIDTRAAASRLAPLVRDRGISLHVSGCEKGCARRHPASATLVGRNGSYDLVRNGASSDAPVRRGLTLDQAAALLRGRGAPNDPRP
jgi:precorrin-3B synthase